MKLKYKAVHLRLLEQGLMVWVHTYIWDTRLLRPRWVLLRKVGNVLPRETSTKDLNRYKKILVEVERQKDLAKEQT